MFSFALQKVLASRKELLEYDCRESKGPLETAASSGSLLLSAGVKGLQGECYGCASAAIEHCVTLLKALAMLPATRKQLVEEVRHYAVCYTMIRMLRTTVTCTIFLTSSNLEGYIWLQCVALHRECTPSWHLTPIVIFLKCLSIMLKFSVNNIATTS